MGPRAMPAVARRNFRRELWATLFFSVGLAVVEGVIIGAIVKGAYTGVVPERPLNFVVALLAALPELANLSSFAWAAIAHGRNKVRVVNALQVVIIAMGVVVALVPRDMGGLVVLFGAVLVARVAMAGVFTLRATVWNQNYSRADRARTTGWFTTVQVLTLAGVGLSIGAARDLGDEVFRVLILVACLAGALGVIGYSRVRLRRRKILLRAELRGGAADRPTLNPLSLAQVLVGDGNYARFQLWMNVLGLGNLMLTAPWLIMLKEQFGLGTFKTVLITYALPCLVMPLVIPFWARLLSSRHVVEFRAVHSWVFVVSQTTILLGVVAHRIELMFVGAVLQGIGYAGGSLAWNLGHLDFAPAHRASQYMGVHVTLNGVRGLLGPLLAVSLYEGLKGLRPGLEHWVLALSVLVVAAGAIGFRSLARRMRTSDGPIPRPA